MRGNRHFEVGRSNNIRGFTLLEVLLVLTLLAGVGFVLLVKLPVQLNERNLALASTQLMQDIRDTRARALAENTWFEIRFFEANNTYHIYQKNTLLQNISLPENIRFTNSPNTIRFSAEGVPSFLGTAPIKGSVSLTNGKQTRVIITAVITGRVREEVR